MKKALALLLTLAMLATMTAVPAWAEEDVEIDIPVIEEVTEEELEEVSLFTEEEITEEETDNSTDVPNVTWNTFVPAADDGVTYLTELTGANVTATGTKQGNLASVYNGIYTEGVKMTADEYAEYEANLPEGKELMSFNAMNDSYPKINGAAEGFMGGIAGKADPTTVIIDLGESDAVSTYSGIRLVDDTKARGMNARKATKLNIEVSDNGTEWVYMTPISGTRTDGNNYADFLFAKKGVLANLDARYIKFTVESVNEHEQFDIEEIILLDANADNETLAPSGFELDYYTNASDWTWTAKEWVASTPVTNLYDGTLYGGQGNCWHSPTSLTTLYDAPITIMFDEPTDVGGVRLYPRTDGGGASPSVITVQGTYDGENWVDVIKSANLGINWQVQAPGSAYVIPGRNTEFMGIKILIDKRCDGATTGHTCFTELEVLKPVASRSPFKTDEFDYDYPVGDAHVYRIKGETISETRKGYGYIIHDGIYLTPEWFKELGGSGGGYTDYQIHNDWCISASSQSTYTADSVYIVYDMGKVYEFSGIRLYQRVNGNQNFKEGYISISEDGENWITSDKITVTPAVISTISDVKFGATAYNLKTRYIKIHCTASQAVYHWAFEEVRLLKADEDKETKTAAEIKAIYDNAMSAVTGVINKYEAYEVTLENAQEVMEAKSLYDNILNDAQKETVDGDKLATLNDAATELTHTVKVNTASAAAPSGTVHSGNIGFATVDYKLYLAPDVTITGVTYDGNAISNANKEWSVGEKAADGSVTLTLGGRYYGSDMQGRLADSVIASIQNGLNESHGYYSKTTGAIGDLTTGVTVLTEDTFSGKFVREITMNHIGDNKITVNLSDGTTKEINLVADYVWANVPTGSATGSKDTDAITPKTSWKYATNLYSGDNVTVRGGKFFDGDYTYNNYSATYTSSVNEYAADGTVSKNHAYNHIAISWVNGVWLDFGEPTSLSGVRLHMMETGNCFLYEGQVYGSNDLDSTNWTLLGTATSGGTRDMTIDFGENVTYQYIRIVMPRYGTEKWNRLVEIAVLAPKTYLVSASEIAVDTGAGEVAEFDFDVLTGEVVTSLKDAEDADVPYTMEDGTLTIADSYLKGVADGAHTFTVTFTNGQTFTLKVTKGDTSKVDYLLYGYNNSTDLVLTNKTGKTVSSVTVVNGDVRADVAFIQSDDKGTITVKRQFFRRATDLYSTIDVDAPGKVNVEVKFDDNETFTYEVTVDSSWIDVTGEKTATYAYDEIVPGAWKARVSSGNNINAGPHPLIKAPYAARNSQNWHTFFGGIDGTVYGDSTKAIGHYYEIDFGENPEPYNGIRHLERAGGTTWNTNVTIVAKNAAEDEWTELYNGKPIYTSIGTVTDNLGTIHRWQTEMRFDDSYTYRYVRIHIKSSSEHITADNIKILKDTARLTGEATVTGDIVEAEEASFSFYVPAGAAGVVSVANGETALDAANYTFIDNVLTIKADYVATLGASTTLTVTIDGTAIDVTILRKDIYSATYQITGGTEGRGTDDLVLIIPAGKVPTGITYGEKTIAVDPEKIPVDLVAGEKSLTIKRYTIRDLDDLFDMTELKFNVNFSDGSSKEYKVALSKEGKALTGIKTDAFTADEIVPTEGAWTIMASASNNSGEHVNLAFAKSATGNNAWHSAYTGVKNEKGETVAKRDSGVSRFYVDVDFGTATEIAGVRYYERVSHDSGVWNGVSVYGKDASGNWVLIKSQAFDVDALKNTAAAVVDVNFAEKVKYKEVRLVIDGTDYVTAKAIAFLNTIPVPEVEEEEVNIKVTPSTGGNVYIVEGEGETTTPSLGDNVVTKNTETTFKVSDTNLFQYWIEANTGKVLGHEEYLKVKATVGKDIKAVFADPDSSEVFVSFYGRNAKSIVSHGYIKKGTAPKEPSAAQLYTTGYKFSKWVDKDGNDVTITDVLNEGKSFYAEYTAKETKQSIITVTNGTVQLADEKDEAIAERSYAYDTYVKVTANAAPAGEKFSHWVSEGKIVSYANPYKFFVPDHDITLTAVYVAEDATVEEKIDIVMTVTKDSVNGIKVASFLTTRIVPEKAEVIETGIIYVKDVTDANGAVYTKDTLTIAAVGTTSANGKAVKVATCDKTGSGQYKLTSSYYEIGIAARGFITYLEGGAVKTVYTDVITVTE